MVVLLIFPVIFQTVINLRMLSVGRQGWGHLRHTEVPHHPDTCGGDA